MYISGNMKIELWKDLTWKEACEKVLNGNGKYRPLLMREIDDLTRQGILNPDIFPLWTGTFVKYVGTNCEVTEAGKTTKCKLPEKEGWYLPDKFGIPNGEPSDENNPEARYLWRKDKNECPLARYYVRWDGFRRCVDAGSNPMLRFGVLVEVKE